MSPKPELNQNGKYPPEGEVCLAVMIHLHAPEFDNFESDDYARAIKTRLEQLVGFRVEDISVTNTSDIADEVISIVRLLVSDEIPFPFTIQDSGFGLN